MKLRTTLFGTVVLFGCYMQPLTSAYAVGPSFDCSRAFHADEITICVTPQLAAIDILNSTAFYQAKRNSRSVALKLARDFLARRRACGFNAACIYNEQVGIMILYRALGATVLDW